MRKFTRTAGAIVATATLLCGGAAVMATTASAAGTVEGCPFGDVCVYPQNAGWNGGHPSLTFYTYGAHNLSNQLGSHYVFNNQSGAAVARLCTGYNGVGCGTEGHPGQVINANLTPINSIVLQANP